MNHHAFFVAGDREAGITNALAFGERVLKLPSRGNPDVIVLRHELLSVEDARSLRDRAFGTALGDAGKLIVVGASRIFHEAQNALLKITEEPPEKTTLILVVPSEGDLIPTLRSRLLPLPREHAEEYVLADAFIAARSAAREKLISGILAHAGSEKPDEKQSARADALRLAEGLLVRGYALRLAGDASPALTAYLSDLSRLIPILHERSAPLKPILEHISLVFPRG